MVFQALMLVKLFDAVYSVCGASGRVRANVGWSQLEKISVRFWPATEPVRLQGLAEQYFGPPLSAHAIPNRTDTCPKTHKIGNGGTSRFVTHFIID